jgi:hypothetical protein
VGADDQEIPSARSDDDLLTPAQRTQVLNHEIRVLGLSGYHVEARMDHHVVMGNDAAQLPRVEMFIDKFGDVHRV